MRTSDGEKKLVLDSRLFNLDAIIMEYESRLIKPDPVIKNNHRETQE